ncbi:MAG TPA: apolipoprotein N-acyltransferase [Acidimicrobiia bacterium]
MTAPPTTAPVRPSPGAAPLQPPLGRPLAEARAERRRDRVRIAAAVGSGLLLSTAFPPYDLGPVALVAIAPLFWSWRDATPRKAALYGFWWGIAFFGMLLSWTWYFGAVAFVPLVWAGGLYIALPGALVATFARYNLRSPWLTAAVWVLFEQLRGRFPFGGLPWGETGATLHDLPAARALASWGGIAFVTFLVVACNGFVADAFVSTRARSARGLAFASAGMAAIVAVAAVGYAFRFQPTQQGELRVATLQGNDQNRDIEDPIEFEQVVVESHFELADQLEGEYDLVVFPESALNRDPEVDTVLRDRIVAIGAEHDAVMLVNALQPAPVTVEGKDYNTNLVFDPDGNLQGTYAKQHLVPFGEYVPFRRQLDFLGALDQIPYDYAHGKGRRLFEVDGHRMATVICFESAFGPLVRDFVRDGAEFVVVTTNNRSYRRSGNARQHLALSQMRAAEIGRPMVQASISGVSAFIDPEGDVHDTTDLFVNTTNIGEITPTTGQTPYVRYGDWVLWGSGLALIGLALFARLRRPVAPTGPGGPGANASS